MATTHGEIELQTIEDELNKILKNPEVFHRPQIENTNNIKQLSQKSYCAAVSDELFKGRSLSKLLIDGFDEEQIWQQSDVLNKAAASNISDFIRNFTSYNLSSVLSSNSLSNAPLIKNVGDDFLTNEKNKSVEENSINSQESSAEEDYAFDDDSDSASELNSKLTGNELPPKHSEYGSDNHEEFNSNDECETKSKSKQLSKEKSQYKSIVDDQFFKLSKLENFLKIEDLKEERGDDSNVDIDLFQDIPSDDCDVTDDESENAVYETKKSSRDLMYEDFFDDPESEVEGEINCSLSNEDGNSVENEDSRYPFDDKDEFDIEMKNNQKERSQLNKIPENSFNNCEDKKTKFEVEQEKIKEKIQEYEKTMLQPLPWHLTGEVAAEKRPIDSLLEQEADFDSNTKQDILVDKDLNEKIEEITIMAIRNKAFFDVERKYKRVEDITTYKKEVIIEQTKSKKSLAEVYEEDYLKKQHKQDTEEEDPKHKEIKNLMNTLLPQLHALFSHIPKPAVPEIKIVSNLPAITVEEVAPTNVSDATLLAPEEVKKKTGVLKGMTERTDTDRKRERRKKKIHQRLKEKKNLEKLESQKQNPSAKVSKLEKMHTLKKLKQHKNTKIGTVDESGKIKSSKDFFSRLQDTVQIKNKTKILGKHKKKI